MQPYYFNSVIFLILLMFVGTSTSYNTNTCFGVSASSGSPSAGCSNDGYCIDTNRCACFAGYASPNCSKLDFGFTFASGLNNFGQLGDGFYDSHLVPYRVAGWFGIMNISMISAGLNYSLALTTNGEVFAWGYNGYGVLGTNDTKDRILPTLVQGTLQGKKIVSIAACYYHSLAVDSNGIVYSWGTNRDTSGNNYGWLGVSQSTTSPDYTPTDAIYDPQLSPITVVSGVLPNDVISVGCGRYHSTALTSSGQIWFWGSSYYGQGGGGQSSTVYPIPQQVSINIGSMTIVKVVSGWYHIVALTSDNAVYAWGWEEDGQIGNGNIHGTQTVPLLISSADFGGKTIVDVGAAPNSSFAVTSDGYIYAWGSNSALQLLESATTTYSSVPFEIGLPGSLNGTISAIFSSCVSNTMFALTSGGILGAWGDNSNGNFGNDIIGPVAGSAASIVPLPLSKTNYVSISPGVTHSLYIVDGITCYSIFQTDPNVCSAHGSCTAVDHCQCNNGYTGLDCSLPICNNINASDPSVCSGHGLCMTVDTCICHKSYYGDQCQNTITGFLYGAGDNSYGQLADNNGGYNVQQYIPVKSLAFTKTVTAVAAGTYFSLILNSSGVLYSVGLNDNGQLGDGTTANSNTPLIIEGPWTNNASLIVDICVGSKFSMALDERGNVYAWGSNSYGQLGTGNTISSSSPQQVEGILLGEPVIAISCGSNHSAALTFNGTLFAWGHNTQGELGDNTQSNALEPEQIYITGLLYKKRVSSVALGDNHTLAVVNDGTVYAWGSNTQGQLGDGTYTNRILPVLIGGLLQGKNVIAIAAGGQSSYAATSDGELYAWGDCSSSQLGTGCTSGTVNTPTPVTASSSFLWSQNVISISASLTLPAWAGTLPYDTSVLVITANQTTLAWGNNNFGQLGDGTLSTQSMPQEYNLQFPTRTSLAISTSTTNSFVIYGGPYYCFDVVKDSPSVCSYRGNCTAQDTCHCQNGYSGRDCSYYTCYGILTNETEVCSSQGKCIAFDTCFCNVGYAGDQCEKKVFGITYGLGYQNPAIPPQFQLANDNVNGTYTTTPLIAQGLLTRQYVSLVDASQFYSLALGTNNVLYTWGQNNYGQVGDGTTNTVSRPFNVLSSIVSACAGYNHFTAVSSDGTVYGSGIYINSFSSVISPVIVTGIPSNEKPVYVSCGSYFSSVVTADGAVWSFGQSSNGQLGYGDYPQGQFIPQQPNRLKNVLKTVGGAYHQLALDIHGVVYAWGSNNYGQLGDGTSTDKHVPVAVYGLLQGQVVVDIGATAFSSYAITADGKVYAWGSNAGGQLGDGTTTDRHTPILVDIEGVHIVSINGNKDLTSIANGYVIAIAKNGSAFAWGYNAYGNLGTDNTDVTLSPAQVSNSRLENGDSIIAAGLGFGHTLFIYNGTFCFGILHDDPTVCSWRGNCTGSDHCECENDYFGKDCSLTTCYGVNSSSDEVCSGHGTCVAYDSCACSSSFSGHNCELSVFGYTYTVGLNNQGQLGNDYYASSLIPERTAAPLSYGTYIKFVAAGPDNSFAIDTAGILYQWGSNSNGRTGDGTNSGYQIAPVIPLGTGNQYISVCTSNYFSAAIDSLGKVYTWGWNMLPQGPPPTCEQQYCQTSYCCSTTCCAGTNCCSGTIWWSYCQTYGYNTFDCGYWWSTSASRSSCDSRCNMDFPSGAGWLGMNSSYYFNFYPTQIPMPNASDPAVKIVCGDKHMLVLTEANNIYGFGDNSYGQIGDYTFGYPNIFSPVNVGSMFNDVRIIDIEAGYSYSMAISDKGAVYVWGANTDGQLGDETYRNVWHPEMVIGSLFSQPAIKIAAGRVTAYALTAEGTIYSWGGNNAGQLGINSTQSSVPTPSLVPDLFNMSSVTASVWDDYALTTSIYGAGAFGWGDNQNGAFGDGTTTTRYYPSEIVNPFKGRQIVGFAAGQNHAVFIYNGTYCYNIPADDPTVCNWRGTCTANDHCECEKGYFGKDCKLTTCYAVNSTTDEVCSGYGTCVALDSCSCAPFFTGHNCELPMKGLTFTVGADNNGQLGDGNNINRMQPVQPTYPLGNGGFVKFVTAGPDISWAITTSGSLFGWGSSQPPELTWGVGRLGDGNPSTIARSPMLRNVGSDKIVSVCSGVYHTAVADSYGNVYTWGYNTNVNPLTCQRVYNCYPACQSWSSYYNCQCWACTCYYCAVYYPSCGTYSCTGNNQASCNTNCNWFITPFGALGTSQSGTPIGQQYYSFVPLQVTTGLPSNITDPVIQVACGEQHTVALTLTGKVFVWGDNSYGQLGIGSTGGSIQSPQQSGTNTPITGILPNNIIVIAAGKQHSMALSALGAVYTWGSNSNGQLGDGTYTGNRFPRQVMGAIYKEYIVKISAGNYASYALSSSGRVFSWGSNSHGMLGQNNTNANEASPTMIPNLNDISSISAGVWSDSVQAVSLYDSTAFAWGSDSYGILDDNSTQSEYSPVRILPLYSDSFIISSVVGDIHSVFIYNSTFCFGLIADNPMVCSWRGSCVANDYCHCDEGYMGPDCSETVCYGYNSTDSKVCSGNGVCVGFDCCACDTGFTGQNCDVNIFGLAYALGTDGSGELGNNFNYNELLPVHVGYPLSYSTYVKFAAAGPGVSFVITTNGELFGWGYNGYGQLGDGTSISSNHPIRIYAGTDYFKSVCVGMYHTAAVDTNGHVFTWGTNYYGQLGLGSTANSWSPAQVSGQISTSDVFKSVSCGVGHTLAVTTTGAVFGWGLNTNGQVDDPSVYGLYVYSPVRIQNNANLGQEMSNKFVVDVQAGNQHSIALGNHGEVYTWGSSSNGAIGSGSTVDFPQNNGLSKQVLGPLFKINVIKIAAGDISSYAVTSDGSVFAWGGNNNYQLGLNNTVQENSPVQIPNLTNVTSISAGRWNNYVMITVNEDIAYGWGVNNFGQIGDGSTGIATVPTEVNDSKFPQSFPVFAAAGNTHTIFIYNGTYCYGILSDDPMVCSWRGTCEGRDQCHCDDGYEGSDCSISICFGYNSSDNDVCSGNGVCVGFDSCSCNEGFTGKECELKVFGLVYTLGSDIYGELGDDYYANQLLPVQTAYPLSYGAFVKFAAAGPGVSFVITTDGELYGWGYNAYGQLGDGTNTNRNIPVRVNAGTNYFVSVCVGMYHTAAVDTNGTVWTWGTNTYPYPTITGQLGLGSIYSSWSPAQVSGQISTSDVFKSVSCGIAHTLAVTATGAVFGWGLNTNGQVDDPSVYGPYILTPTQIQTNPNTGEEMANKYIVDVQAGGLHSIALGSHGEVYTWGQGTYGAIGNGFVSDLPHATQVKGLLFKETIVKIAAGQTSSYAITSEGRIFAWGGNNNYQLGLNNTVQQNTPVQIPNPINVTSISTGKFNDYVMVTTSEGVSFGWGVNNMGQIGDNSTETATVPTKVNDSKFPLSFAVFIAAGNNHTIFIYNGTYCYGILSDDPAVCAFRGECQSHDNCVCNPQEYEGSNCTIPICYNTTADDSAVCSGNGRCLYADTCSCLPGYSGDDCSTVELLFLYASGDDYYSELGDGFFQNQNAPTQSSILSGNNIHIIAAGYGSSFAAKIDSPGIYSWGNNNNGQLGDGTTFSEYYPTKILTSNQIIKIVACPSYTLAIDSDYILYAWGNNAYGQLGTGNTNTYLSPIIVPGFDNVNIIDVACGQGHVVALTSAGLVYTWGSNSMGQLGDGISGNNNYNPTRVQFLMNIKTIVKVTAGSSHTLVMAEDGTLFAWGNNANGQLGDGTTTSRVRPYPIFSSHLYGQNVISIDAGLYSSYAILEDGSLFAWGASIYGELGDGTTSSQVYPSLILFNTNFAATKVFAGSYFTLVLTANGTAFSFGLNNVGQLGEGTNVFQQLSPTPVVGTIPQKYITDMAAGNTHTLFLYAGMSCFGILFDDPSVCSWRGNCTANDYCECPPEYGGRDCSISQCFGIDSNSSDVCSFHGSCVSLDTCVCAQGYYGENCELSGFGYLFASGNDSYSQLADGDIGIQIHVHQAVLFNEISMNLIVAGFDYTLLKTTEGQVYSLGLNNYGQLGDGTNASRSLPVQILTGKNIVGLCGGFNHAMALDDAGSVWVWGSNTYGQLGLGENVTETWNPMLLNSGALDDVEVLSISCGYYHSMALTMNGTVITWGYNQDGELGDNTFTTRYSPVVVGGSLSNKFIVSISAGYFHSMALGSEGTVHTWGLNNRGQLGDTTTTNKFVPVQVAGALFGKTVSYITAGGSHSLAVMDDGLLYSWGANNAGQLGDDTLIDTSSPTLVNDLVESKIVIVSAGSNFTLALAENKTAYAWGDNTYGQLGNGEYNVSAVSTPVQVVAYYQYTYVSAISAGNSFSLFLYNGTTCFRKFVEDPTVCSTKGNCTAFDICQCEYYYNAADCSTYYCFGKNKTDPQVCNGQGTCVAADACVCRPGYIGLYCEKQVSGYVFSVGAGSLGQAGDGYLFPIRTSPYEVAGALSGISISEIAAGEGFTLAITVDGELYAWGQNNYGQLGDGTFNNAILPSKAVGLPNKMVTICAGTSFSAAVDELGQVWTWGNNYNGQLGNDDYTFSPSPVPISVGGIITNTTIVSVACGASHVIALSNTGLVYGWGNNVDGELGDGTNNNRLLPVQVGVGIIDNLFISKVRAGMYHSLAIAPFGVLYAWGRNDYGQLGDGSTFNKYSPTMVTSSELRGRTAVDISGNEQDSYVLFIDGTIFSWGGDFYGQIGDNSSRIQSKSAPQLIGTPNNILKGARVLATGRNYAFSLNSAGVAYAWGSNSEAQLGNGLYGANAQENYPVQVVNNYPKRVIVAISAGSQHTAFIYNATACYGFLDDDPNVCSSKGQCIATNDCQCLPGFQWRDCSVVICNGYMSRDPDVCSAQGTCLPNNTCICYPLWSGYNCEKTSFGYLFGAGDDQDGQLGDGSTQNEEQIVKSRASAINKKPMQYAIGGQSFSIAITTNGEIYSMGLNNLGQLGDGTTDNAQMDPVLTSISSMNLSISTIAVGYSFAVATLTNGSTYGWGSNANYQLGIGTSANTLYPSPTILFGLDGLNITAISCALIHCLALTREGVLYSWGGNANGQLGDGTTGDSNSQALPIKVRSIFDIKKAAGIFAGAYHSLAITVDGIVYAWGDNTRGELGNNQSSLNPQVIPAQVVGPLNGEIAVQITGGEYFSCALTKINQVWCWGANDYGQLGDGTNVDRFYPARVIDPVASETIVSISGGGDGFMIALTDDGRVFGWGYNSDGQLADGTTINRLTPIEIGNYTRRYSEYITAGYSHMLSLYNGTTCFNILEDDPDVCSGNGTCIDWDTCICKPGFSGKNCEFTSCYGINMTDPTVCSGRGECKYLNTCICDPTKWSGDMCQYINCFGKLSDDPNVCSHHGSCVGPANCSCNEGYDGNNCQYTICYGRDTSDSLVCSGNGICFSPDNRVCMNFPTPGYTGGNCSAAICYSKFTDRLTGEITILQLPLSTLSLDVDTSLVCSGHGMCKSPSVCECDIGYTDPYCSTPICFGINATEPAACNYGKNGTCIAYDNCTCLTHFNAQGECVPLTCFGLNSTTDPPACNAEKGHGNCLNVNLCACTTGYGGLQCEWNICNGILQDNYTFVCHGRGSCLKPDYCQCLPGYNGTDCQYIDCYGKLDVDQNVCSGNGQCVLPNTCQCDEGYAGSQCEFTICYEKWSNDTLHVCSDHGICVTPDNCQCHFGYSGLECFYSSCFGINQTDTTVCSNSQGFCYAPDKCNCSAGFVSLDCSIPTCFGYWSTNESVCSGYGLCLEPDVCVCNHGRTGSNCELNVCFGFNETDPKACSGNGICYGPETCNCTVNKWTGEDCSVPICFGKTALDPLVCSSKGQCLTPDNCTCNNARTGFNCQFNICYGKNETDPSVCNGHGLCTGENYCDCFNGYTSDNCSLPICFGISADHHDTCQGFGVCIAPDTCNCTTGKTGAYCQLNICFGVNQTDPSTCSGNGQCIDTDVCQCNPGRTGKNCELNTCFQLNQSDINVCSGNGICISPDQCKCSNGWIGENCQFAICNGIYGNDSQVCSGKGICIGFNTCQCYTGYSGSNCEFTEENCIQSNSYLLISLVDPNLQDVVNISLVDMNCGIAFYSFYVPVSSVYVYNKYAQSFILLGSQGIYAANSQGATLLRGLSPLVNISNAAVFVGTSDSINAVTLSPGSVIQLFLLNLFDSSKDKIFSNAQFISIGGTNDNRFITIDSLSGNIYALAKNNLTDNISIVQINPSLGSITEYVSFNPNNFPAVSELEALLFVNGFVHIMSKTFIYRVQNGVLSSIFNLISEFFDSYKVESDSMIYLDNKVGNYFAYTSKYKPLNLIFSNYPAYIRGLDFKIIGSWNTQITNIYPSYLPASMTGSWIILSGQYLNLNNQSTITLTDSALGYTITTPITDCAIINENGDACFKPNLYWSLDISYFNFSIRINIAGNNSTAYDSGLTLTYYKTEITRLFPTTAITGETISIYAPWYYLEANISCIFSNTRTGQEIIVPVSAVYNQRVDCIVPYFANVTTNDIIQISSDMGGNIFNPQNLPAFFYFVNSLTQDYYNTFDVYNLFDNFTVVEGSDALSFVWIPFDEATSRSLINMTSTLSNSVSRSKIMSIDPLITRLDQQVVVEFLVESTQVGNVIEVWILSAIDSSYIYGSFGMDPYGNAYISLVYKIDANFIQENSFTASCSPFKPVPEDAYKLVVRTVRPDVELYNKNITAFNEWLLTQNITANETVPSVPWRIDVMLEYSTADNCSMSFTPNVTTEDMEIRFINSSIALSQSTYQNSNVRKLQGIESTTTISASIDRIWVECQYTVCNLSTFPKESHSFTENVRSSNIAIVAFSSITASLLALLILAICIPLIILISWKVFTNRRKKSRQSKLDAWRFEFVLDKNVSSLNDERFTSVARRLYKVQNHKDNKMQAIFRKKVSIKSFSDAEMTDVTAPLSEVENIELHDIVSSDTEIVDNNNRITDSSKGQEILSKYKEPKDL